MVESTGLENQQRGDSFVGSNPTLSAIIKYLKLLLLNLLSLLVPKLIAGQFDNLGFAKFAIQFELKV